MNYLSPARRRRVHADNNVQTCTPVDRTQDSHLSVYRTHAGNNKKHPLSALDDSSSAFLDIGNESLNWRDLIVEQMVVRNAMQLMPFIDITKANPYVPLYDEDKEKERNQGLSQKLQELQASMKHNYRLHRRRTIALILLSAILSVGVIVLAVVFGLSVNQNSNSASKVDCADRVFNITSAATLDELMNSGCNKISKLYITGYEAVPDTIELPGLRSMDDFSVDTLGTEKQPVNISLPDAESIGYLILSKSYVGELYIPNVRSIALGIQMMENTALYNMSANKLSSCGDFELSGIRLRELELPALTTIRSLSLSNCDVGTLSFPNVQMMSTLRISDSGGWSSTGPVYSKPEAEQDQPMSLSPDVLNILCPDQNDCNDRPLLSLFANRPPRPGILGGDVGNAPVRPILRPPAKPAVDENTYGHKDPVANEPTGRESTLSSQRRGAEGRQARDIDSVPLTLKIPQLSTVDTITLIHVADLAPLSLPFVTQLRELKCQFTTFQAGTGYSVSNMAFDALQELTTLTLYMTANLGVLALPSMTRMDAWKLEYNRKLVGIRVGPGSAVLRDSQGSPFGSELGLESMSSVVINTNNDLQEVDLGFVTAIDQSLEVVSNPLLQSFRATNLANAGTVVALFNQALVELSLPALAVGNVLVAKNSKLSGTLAFPALRESGIVIFYGNALDSIQLPMLSRQQLTNGQGSSALWVMSLVTDDTIQMDNTKSLVVVRDEPVQNISLSSLQNAQELYFVENPKLLTVDLGMLAFAYRIVVAGNREMVTLELPALQFCYNITIQQNPKLQKFALPGLKYIAKQLVLNANHQLSIASMPSLEWQRGTNYSIEILLNSPNLCFPDNYFQNVTGGECFIANPEVDLETVWTTAGTTAAALTCTDCCDARVVNQTDSICQYPSADYLKRKYGQLRT